MKNRERFDFHLSGLEISALLLLLDSCIEMDGWSDEINVLRDMGWHAVIIASKMIIASLYVGVHVILRSKQ